MSWIDFLSKLHLVTLEAEVRTDEEASPENAGNIRVRQTLRVSLSDLRNEEEPVDPAVFGADEDIEKRAHKLLSLPWDAIYRVAKVAVPEHGWTMDRVLDLRETDTFRKMQPTKSRNLILAQIARSRADVADILRDAQRRDDALDAFDRHVARRVEEARQASRKTEEEAQARIRELQAVVQREEADRKALDEALAGWTRRKEARERAMAETAEFLSAPPADTE